MDKKALQLPNGNYPLMSVIVPVYNVAPYLREALDSVIHQTYSHLEILIIDDGSTDDSGKICDEYAGKDGRIRLIHQENKGLSAARNVGLDQSAGDYIAFLDPDDAFHPSFVEMLLHAVVRTKADVAICRYTVQRTEGALDRYKKSGKRGALFPAIGPGIYDRMTALRELVGHRINANVWNKLYKKKLWEKLRFPDGRVYEDIETAYKIAERCEKCCVIDSPLYFYRKRPGSITTTYSRKEFSDWMLAESRVHSYISSHIPEFFSEELLERHKAAFLRALMAYYIHIKGSKNDEEALRRLIVKTGKTEATEKLGVRVSASYWLVCHCPWLLKGMYPLYRPVRRLVWAVVRR